jgi:hypothetical protein
MIVIIFDGDAGLLSKILRHTVSLNYLSANAFVFLHEVLQLRLNLLLSQLLRPLLLAKLIESLEQLTMLDFDFVLLDESLLIFLLAAILLALEAGSMALELFVFGAYSGTLVFQVRKLAPHRINLLCESTLVFLEHIDG